MHSCMANSVNPDQSDLGLHWLPMPFYFKLGVSHFRIFTISLFFYWHNCVNFVSAFGSTPSSSAGGGLFGQKTQASTTGLFGTPSSSTAFGGAAGFGGKNHSQIIETIWWASWEKGFSDFWLNQSYSVHAWPLSEAACLVLWLKFPLGMWLIWANSIGYGQTACMPELLLFSNNTMALFSW